MYGTPADGPRERFIAQFDWDGADAIYRARGTGPAYRVTADDYCSFVDDYDRRDRLSRVLLFAGWMAIGAVLLLVPPFAKFFAGRGSATAPIYLLWLLVFASSWFIDHWLSLAPARVLRARAPEAPPLSGDERLSRTVGERSWASLFGTAIVFCLPGLLVLLGSSPFHPRLDVVGALLFAASTGALGWTLVQMIRKWQFEQRRRATA